MSEKSSKNISYKNFWFLDIAVLVVFTCTAVLGLYLFRQDLMQTLDARGLEPVGTIIIRQNVVQRRHEDRTIWDRLFVESPVYSGDLIRVADLSAASIFIEENQLNVNENTIIRIQALAGARGTFEVELQEGNLSLECSAASGDDSTTLLLNLMGNRVEVSGGTVLSAAVSEEGMEVQVNEGKASLFEAAGQAARELFEGSMIAKDSKGAERIVPSVVVTQPKRNANYLKHNEFPLPVTFAWQKINIAEEDENKIRLELSMDRSFKNNVIPIYNPDASVQANFDTGVWYWRFVLDSEKTRVLGSGQITVIDSSGPELLSPVTGSIIRFSGNSPEVRFQWDRKTGASDYNLEISKMVSFNVIHSSKQIKSNSFVQPDLSEGTWYWRVKPNYSSAYAGAAGYSRVGSFTIEKSENLQTASIEIPEPRVIAARIAELVRETAEPVFNAAENITRTQTSVPVLSRGTALPQVQPRREPEITFVPGSQDARPGGTYTVKYGDTLAKIAKQAYGDGTLWTRIFEANNIKNQDLIFPGQVFVIPQ